MDQPSSIERRMAPRVPTALPICLEWHHNEQEIHRTRGMTRDISRSGVYCYLESPLSPGLRVEFEVVFPEELTATDPLKLRCAGLILRSEIQDRRFGAVASIEKFEITETMEPASESDRRSNLRIVPAEAVVAEYPGLRSVLRDMSPTGAFIEDDRPFPIGRLIDLRLRAEGFPTPVDVKAIVRRVEPQIGMAVEFVALSKEAKTFLLRFIEKSRPPRVDALSAHT
jgi:hypothetical protein